MGRKKVTIYQKIQVQTLLRAVLHMQIFGIDWEFQMDVLAMWLKKKNYDYHYKIVVVKGGRS